ncbi:hypothetical protein D0Z03_000460 [Geotrichum reessii]|nr:hypothetical protein D0Z03_000460 [Galactomyces reessii]
MHFSLLSFTTTVAFLASVSAADETILGAFIFGRHGDRLTKPTTTLTALGAHQLLSSGQFYHGRYFDPDSSFRIEGLNLTYHETQLAAQAPNSAVIQMSQWAFFQGLYPPLNSLKGASAEISQKEVIPLSEHLANGTNLDNPLEGYQYIISQGVDDDAPDSIWIKGDENCPNFDASSQRYYQSTEFKTLNESTFNFYQGLSPILGNGIPKAKLNYGNAYSVFDYINVNSIHNGTFASLFAKDDFNKIKWLQDRYTTDLNYNASDSATVIGAKTLLAAMYTNLNATLVARKPLLSMFTGSYDTFSQFFGLIGLIDHDPQTFGGLVNYGASIVLELFTPDGNNTPHVRFFLRNGTEPTDKLTAYPLFGQDVSGIKFADFEDLVNKNAIHDLRGWCTACNAWNIDLCKPVAPTYEALERLLADKNIDISSTVSSPEELAQSLHKILDSDASSDNGLTLAGAGGIGAGVTIGVFLIAGILFMGYNKFMGSKKADVTTKNFEKDDQSSTQYSV